MTLRNLKKYENNRVSLCKVAFKKWGWEGGRARGGGEEGHFVDLRLNVCVIVL